MAVRAFLKSGKDEVRPTEESQRFSMVTVVANMQTKLGEAALCLFCLFLYAVGAGYEGDTLTVINTVGPLLFSLGLIWGIVSLIQRSVNNLWVPLFWYRVAMLVYFGMGALVPLYANESARSMIQNFYEFFPKDLLRLNVLLTVFHLLVLFFSTIIMSIAKNTTKRRKVRSKPFISSSNIGLGACGAIFIIVGGLVNFLVILPSVLGVYDLTILGQFINLSLASLLGYFMLTLWSLRNKSGWLLAVIGAATLETLLGLLVMSKFVALFPGVMVGLGFVFYKPTLRRLAIFASAMLLVFTMLAPVIGYARNSSLLAYAGQAKPLEVASIYISYYSGDMIIDFDKDSQGGWARLSYVNVGAFAMNQYDDGHPGDSLKYAPIIWVPRVLYPDKPYVTDIGKEFTYAINGNYESSTSPGIPAESYWDMGWLGVVIISAALAFLFTLWSFYTYIVIECEAWHLFFVVLFGMRTASRLDGGFVVDILGPLGLAVLAHFAIEFLNRFLPARLAAIFGRRGKKSGARRSPTVSRGALTTRAPSANSNR
ncbi:MAG: hypothetical protein ABIO86_20680 [Sphingomonas sp.]